MEQDQHKDQSKKSETARKGNKLEEDSGKTYEYLSNLNLLENHPLTSYCCKYCSWIFRDYCIQSFSVTKFWFLI